MTEIAHDQRVVHVPAEVWGVQIELEALRRAVVLVDTVAGND